MIIEILHVRDPDGECSHEIVIDGVDIKGAWLSEDVDAGRGYTREDWDEHTEYIRNSTYSEVFKALVIATREDAPGKQYIMEEGRDF